MNPQTGIIESVRLHELSDDILAGQPVEEDGSDDAIEPEGREIKGQKAVWQPSKEEWDAHMRSHVPFRRWCPFCVKGKCKASIHHRKARSSDKDQPEVPKWAWDYMGKKTKDGKQRRIQSLPIIVGLDDPAGYIAANMVPRKGDHPHAIKTLSREVELSGYNRMIFKSCLLYTSPSPRD